MVRQLNSIQPCIHSWPGSRVLSFYLCTHGLEEEYYLSIDVCNHGQAELYLAAGVNESLLGPGLSEMKYTAHGHVNEYHIAMFYLCSSTLTRSRYWELGFVE